MLTLRVVLDKTTILGVAVAPENFEGDLIGGHLQLMILNFSSTPVKPWVRHIILQPLQGVHAARKISARKIPKNSSSCVRKWLQNWNFQYLEKGKQEENTNSGDDGESLLCGGDGLCATFSPVYKSRDQNEEPMTWGFV
ncbi:uncharacterized protein [Malus domestica]|uniref:uncharacterized protein isoform X4 n=1 Tax=Malus domestica TaxID=3750 RepID=UPI003975646F